jgi:hypothetical protein
MKKWERFTRQEIEQFALESNSYAELARKCGYNGKAGSNIKEMHLMVTQLNLDISHFTGQASQKGKTYQTDKYVPFKEYIKGEHVQTNKLRKKLLREGLKEHICECCLNTIWNDVPIPLEVHHKDGDKNNNDIDNLQLLCPNCHALTDTYKGKNIKKHKQNVSN